MNIVKFNEYHNEAVDQLYIPAKDDVVYFSGDDIFPFILGDGEMYIGTEGSTHGDMKYDIIPSHVDELTDYGRIWVEFKTITFWEDINTEKINFIVSELEKGLNIKISGDWNIEYYDMKNEAEIFTTIDKMKNNEKGRELQLSREEYDLRLANHLNGDNKDKSFGSTLTSWDSKNNIKYRYAKYQESTISKYGNFINENLLKGKSKENIIDSIKDRPLKDRLVAVVGGGILDLTKKYMEEIKPQYKDNDFGALLNTLLLQAASNTNSHEVIDYIIEHPLYRVHKHPEMYINFGFNYVFTKLLKEDKIDCSKSTRRILYALRENGDTNSKKMFISYIEDNDINVPKSSVSTFNNLKKQIQNND